MAGTDNIGTIHLSAADEGNSDAQLTVDNNADAYEVNPDIAHQALAAAQMGQSPNGSIPLENQYDGYAEETTHLPRS